MGQGLIPADGEVWRVRRRAVVPALHKRYVASMVRGSERCVCVTCVRCVCVCVFAASSRCCSLQQQRLPPAAAAGCRAAPKPHTHTQLQQPP
jgi:hypothetical protein